MADDPLATWQDVKALTGVDYDTAEQARLAVELARVSRIVRSAAGWHLYPVRTEDVVTVDGSGSNVQMLPTARLTNVHEVKVDDVVVDLARVRWSAAGYLRLRDGRWSCEPRGVVAKITHGYDVLEDVKGLVVDLALAGVFARRAPGIDTLTTGPFAVKINRAADLAPDQLAVLAPYTLGGV